MRMPLVILPNLLTDLNNKEKTYDSVHVIKTMSFTY